ncbi:MAG: methylated-DNA--[protein]-cysteine S-methyltransferase [FCB group bacterium]|jgi:O-6-methylguanine DNA methyltransferase|nr:methylated-DNA--[protein]-cysteine S-methyltransferase [FCB group bacterium]
MEECTIVITQDPGPIAARFSPRGLRELHLGEAHEDTSADAPKDIRKQMDRLQRAMDRYFAGKREDFDGIALDLDGRTAFRRAVWEAARGVRWGEVSTYGGLAERMGKTKGHSRAVGQALGSNPIAIIIPCHRFLACDGSLHGFACGLDWKETLLRLEGMTSFKGMETGILAGVL